MTAKRAISKNRIERIESDIVKLKKSGLIQVLLTVASVVVALVSAVAAVISVTERYDLISPRFEYLSVDGHLNIRQTGGIRGSRETVQLKKLICK